MHLSHLSLTEFRSHPRTRFALDGRPVVLVGLNGAGKTNVLEAVSLLSPGRGLRGAGAEELMRRGTASGWKVTAELHEGPAREAPGTAREVETWAEPGAPRQVRLDGKPQPQVALGRVLRVLWLTPAMDRLWTEAPEGRRRFLDRMAMSFEPAHAEAVLAYDRAMRERNRLLRDRVDDPRWFSALEGRMAEAGALITLRRRAALGRLRAAQDAAGPFPVADLALCGPDGEADPAPGTAAADPLPAARVALPEAAASGGSAHEPPGLAAPAPPPAPRATAPAGSSETPSDAAFRGPYGAAPGGPLAADAAALAAALRASRPRDLATGRTWVGPHRADLLATWAAKGVPARLCSTGEQKALLVSLVLANARALAADGAAPVLLLDEVAAHLDEARRAALHGEVLALGAQAWMTGTGHELFADLGDRAQSLAVAEGPEGSRVRPA